MRDQEIEAALVALLRNVSDRDDPSVADHAVELYLSRFGDDHSARLASVRRLTQAMLAGPDRAAASGAARLAPRAMLRRPR